MSLAPATATDCRPLEADENPRQHRLHPTIPRPPPANTHELIAHNVKARLTITHETNQNGSGDPMDLDATIHTLRQIIG